MTVSAAEDFTSVSESGSGLGWSGETNLQYGGTGSATAVSTLWYNTTKSLVCSVPNFITALANGTEFVSLKVSVGMTPTSGVWTYYAKLTGGSTLSGAVSAGTTHLDGTAAYWGLSGTAQEIFRDLKSGAIKFSIYHSTSSLYEGFEVEVSSITAQLTYRLADTKRAALVQCVV